MNADIHRGGWTFHIGNLILFSKIHRERRIFRIDLGNQHRFLRLFATVGLGLSIALSTTVSLAQEGLFPLEPADTSSPRSTLVNFLDNMTVAHRVFLVAYQEHESNSGLFKTESVLAQERDGVSFLKRAAGSARKISGCVAPVDATVNGPATKTDA